MKKRSTVVGKRLQANDLRKSVDSETSFNLPGTPGLSPKVADKAAFQTPLAKKADKSEHISIGELMELETSYPKDLESSPTDKKKKSFVYILIFLGVGAAIIAAVLALLALNGQDEGEVNEEEIIENPILISFTNEFNLDELCGGELVDDDLPNKVAFGTCLGNTAFLCKDKDLKKEECADENLVCNCEEGVLIGPQQILSDPKQLCVAPDDSNAGICNNTLDGLRFKENLEDTLIDEVFKKAVDFCAINSTTKVCLNEKLALECVNGVFSVLKCGGIGGGDCECGVNEFFQSGLEDICKEKLDELGVCP